MAKSGSVNQGKGQHFGTRHQEEDIDTIFALSISH